MSLNADHIERMNRDCNYPAILLARLEKPMGWWILGYEFSDGMSLTKNVRELGAWGCKRLVQLI